MTKQSEIGCIYLITNIVNGKQYVGKSNHKEPDIRFRQHLKDSKNNNIDRSPLHYAMEKYGKENFIVEKIGNFKNGKSLDNMEAYYAEQFQTYTTDYPGGYNLILCGLPGHNAPHSDETKQKIREKRIGKKASDEARRNQSIAQKGRKPHINNRNATSKRLKGVPKPEEQKQKISNTLKGCKLTPQQRENQLKASQQRVGTKATEQHKQNISKGLTGKPKTEEHKKKLSESKKGKSSDKQRQSLLKTNEVKFKKYFDEGLEKWKNDPVSNSNFKYNINRRYREGKLSSKYVEILKNVTGWNLPKHFE